MRRALAGKIASLVADWRVAGWPAKFGAVSQGRIPVVECYRWGPSSNHRRGVAPYVGLGVDFLAETKAGDDRGGRLDRDRCPIERRA